MRSRLLATAALLALPGLAAAPHAAHADPTQYYVTDPSPFQNGAVGVTLNLGSWSENVQAGQITITAKNMSTNVGNAMQVYCVDIFDGLANSTDEVNTIGTMLSNTETATENGIGALIANGNPLVNGTVSSAALQIAIWDVLYNGFPTTADVAHGNFHVSNISNTWSGVVPAADADLENLINGTWTLPSQDTVEVFQPVSGTSQYLAYVAVPEPASLALLGAGLLGLVAVRRRGQAAGAAVGA